MPHETYEQKKELAKWVNAELRPLGLALMCPKTKKPSLLQAYQGDHPEIGRFRFDYIDSDGRRRQPFSSAELPQLIVIPDDLSRAAYGSRSQRGRS